MLIVEDFSKSLRLKMRSHERPSSLSGSSPEAFFCCIFDERNPEGLDEDPIIRKFRIVQKEENYVASFLGKSTITFFALYAHLLRTKRETI